MSKLTSYTSSQLNLRGDMRAQPSASLSPLAKTPVTRSSCPHMEKTLRGGTVQTGCDRNTKGMKKKMMRARWTAREAARRDGRARGRRGATASQLARVRARGIPRSSRSSARADQNNKGLILSNVSRHNPGFPTVKGPAAM
ncbi:unnamed protein product [Lota lota]